MYTIGMKTTIRTWGNSLAIRIPKVFAMHIGIDSGKEVELSIDHDGLRIAPAAEDLRTLLDGITPENRHAETDWGAPAGREVW